jgi:hypothetical protein
MSDYRITDDEARALWPALPGISDCEILFASRGKVWLPSHILAAWDGDICYAYAYLSGYPSRRSAWYAVGISRVCLHMPAELMPYFDEWLFGPERSATPAVSRDNGFHTMPARYEGIREPVDQWRDAALVLARDIARDPDEIRGIADKVFAFACGTHAQKYAHRAGAKGDPSGDEEKRRFYTMMEAHALNPDTAPDPRCFRPGFVPYTYPEED